MSDTPRTAAAGLRIESDDSSCAIYCFTEDGSAYYGEVCRADEMSAIERELNEANADRLRLREAFELAFSLAHRDDDQFSEEDSETLCKLNETIKTPPPPVVAKDDAEALRIDLNAIRMICEAEGMVVTIGDKSLENYRVKYKEGT